MADPSRLRYMAQIDFDEDSWGPTVLKICMRRLFAVLLLVLGAVALNAAVGSRLFAGSTAPHDHSGEAMMSALHVEDAGEKCGHHDCKSGKCTCLACCSACVASFVAPASFFLQLGVQTALVIPENSWLDGITVQPVTSPPKLSA
jgi:hypothetical protein